MVNLSEDVVSGYADKTITNIIKTIFIHTKTQAFGFFVLENSVPKPAEFQSPGLRT